MSSFKIYRIAIATTSTPYSFTGGTTAAAVGPYLADDKGVEVTFQNQSTAATNVWIGGSTMSISIGTTSTVGAGGIILAQNGTFSLGHRTTYSGIQMNDWYVASTSSNAVCTALLLKAV